MMTNGDLSHSQQSQNPQNPNGHPASGDPQSAAILQQYFGVFGQHPQYGVDTMSASLGAGDGQSTPSFFPFLPPSSTHSSVANNPNGQPPLFPDFAATHPYYYSATNPALRNNPDSRPGPAISPTDLKYPLNGGVETLDTSARTAGSSTDGSSPFDANANGSAGAVPGGHPFYNQFIQDQYLSAAMGAATDSYPSTSFMGVNPYSHAYYPYPTNAASTTHHPNSATLSSAAAMDLMQTHQQSMFGHWKYGNGTEKLTKSTGHGIKSSSTSSLSHRPSNPPHKIGPGTNNVRVRTLDKYRTVYTDRQRLELEKEFRSHQFVTTERKAVLAGELELTERQVKIWFQNRRAKSRKQEPTHRSMRVMSAMTR